MTGKFITFEGADGVGKSTAVKGVAKRLEADGHRVIMIKTPGYDDVGSRIRKIVLDPDIDLNGISRYLMFLADMIQTHRSTVVPATERGVTVLCDRYMDSTIVYQLLAADFWPDLHVKTAARDMILKSLPFPDMTFVIDLPVDIAYQRAMQMTGKKGTGPTGDVFEQAPLETWDRRRRAYLALLQMTGEPRGYGFEGRCMTLINALDKTPKDIADEIYREIATQMEVSA